MTTYRRILLGTDLSDPALHAAALAKRLQRDDVRLRVAFVAPIADTPRRSAAESAHVKALAEWCDRAGLTACEQAVLYGNPAEEISREAAGMEADLLVIGHRGRSPIERLLLGSTARSLLRLAVADTLVVRGQPPGTGAAAFHDIVVATDFYEPSARAARRALALAKEQGANLAVVHVIDPDMWRMAVRATPRDEFPDDEALLRGTYNDMLAQFNKEHLEGRAKEQVTHGSPAKALADHARSRRVDLIVVGTHGTHGIERMLLGAHAESIIEHAPCSVLVVR